MITDTSMASILTADIWSTNHKIWFRAKELWRKGLDPETNSIDANAANTSTIAKT